MPVASVSAQAGATSPVEMAGPALLAALRDGDARRARRRRTA